MTQDVVIYNFGTAEHTDDWNFKVPGSVFWRIYRLREGSARVHIRERDHILKSGHLYIIPPFTMHEDILQGTFVHDYLHFRIEDTSLSEFIENFDLPFETESDGMADGIFTRMEELCGDFRLETCVPSEYEKSSSYIYWTKRFMSLTSSVRFELENCVRMLLTRFINAGGPRRYTGSPEMQRVKNYIDVRFTEDIPIADLARMAGIRPESFIRAFRKTFGEPPHAYITRRRINKAKDLLMLTTLSVKEIAARVGYHSFSHFCLAFRRHTSLSPSYFRRH